MVAVNVTTWSPADALGCVTTAVPLTGFKYSSLFDVQLIPDTNGPTRGNSKLSRTADTSPKSSASVMKLSNLVGSVRLLIAAPLISRPFSA